MSDKTKIEWTDATWNPVTGCTVLSAGCKHCYAMKLAGGRLKHHPSRAGLTVDTAAGPVWNGAVRLNEGWLEQPLHWSRSRRVFVCAHGDLFHENVPDEWIDRVFAVMAQSPQHQYQVLTKRAERMLHYFNTGDGEGGTRHGAIAGMLQDSPESWPERAGKLTWPLPNVWLGVSVEHQEAADERIPLLLQTPAAIHFLSCEPLLGPLDIVPYLGFRTIKCGCGWRRDEQGLIGARIENEYCSVCGEITHTHPSVMWVIAGGESGTGARPMHPEWVRSLRNQCEETHTAFHFKQWGAWSPIEFENAQVFPPTVPAWDKRRRHKFDARTYAVLEGDKHLTGRMLDGRTWDQYPDTGKFP